MSGKSKIQNRKSETCKVLTIAGSDSGGGAGIQGDLKTIQALGGYGMSAITALTAQNTLGVRGILPVPPRFVALQIETVLSDIGVDAVKTGMLANAGIIAAVARTLAKYRVRKLVVDPVMVSKSGHALLEPGAEKALVKQLLPLALLVTPNLAEAARLAGFPVETREGMIHAARAIQRLGARNVLVKGGHLAGDPVDMLLKGRQIIEIRGERLRSGPAHGTGCALASAIATLLAQGHDLVESVRGAKAFVAEGMRRGFRVGRGHGVLGTVMRDP